ncbi:uncharacterized protein LODBEIA_P19570 [Lodderomyces beijingensis]|uniref:Phosphoribulokinase/uridine kinase domain-containing protein n=1 Tax=Lodderomyces beijingensis TaxID=1775926 RepID=A0ABP0ZHW4_9ASCO
MTTETTSLDFISNAIDSKGPLQWKEPLLVGVSGPQGSGKSYLTSHLALQLQRKYPNLNIIQFSIDDFYLTRADQAQLTQESKLDDNHLLQGRGLPGTHDLPLLTSVLDSLISNYTNTSWTPVRVPFYDKSAYGGLGDRSTTDYQNVYRPADVIICEGWFTGFTPVSADLTRLKYLTHSPDSIVQRHKLYQIEDINERLRAYVPIWQTFAIFIVLKTDSILDVYEWRLEQEHWLIQMKGEGMNDEQVTRFIDRYMPVYELYYDTLCDKGLPDSKCLIMEIDIKRNMKSYKFL